MHAAQYEITARTELGHWWFVARRRILREVIADVIPSSPNLLVIDIGCATGGNIAALAEDYACFGVDPSADAIRWARRRCPGIEFLCGRAPDHLEGTAERFDLFLLADFLEHVEYDSETFASLIAAAKPGAYFLITVPADMSLWSRHDESHGHYRRYDVESLARVWEGLPVSVGLLSYFNARLYPVVKAARWIGRLRGRAFGEADTDLRTPSRPVNWLLERVFAGERRRLLAVLRGERKHGYRRGVSVIALLRREEELTVSRECACYFALSPLGSS